MQTKKQETRHNNGHSDVPPRFGKTKKDRESGKMRRNISNRQERADWQKSSSADAKNFPYKTCNGKRNRYSFAKPVKHSNPATGANYHSKKAHGARVS